MELHAMKSGKRLRDDAFIDATWQQSVKRAASLEESKKYYEAYEIYLGLAESFKGLREVGEVEGKASQLRDSHEVKDAIREEQQQIRKQTIEVQRRLKQSQSCSPRAGWYIHLPVRTGIKSPANREALSRSHHHFQIGD